MGKVTSIALLSLSVINCELVVTPEEEGTLSSDYLLANAEVVSKYHQEGRCPEVKDEVRILRYFVQVGPDEREERNVGALVSQNEEPVKNKNIFVLVQYNFQTDTLRSRLVPVISSSTNIPGVMRVGFLDDRELSEP